jgi:monovalent cation:H+ antiporter-2, CPA2 family
VGSAIGYALETFGVRYLTVEIDPDVLETAQARDVSYIFGDCAHSHILERAGLSRASLLIVTVPDHDRARMAVINARKLNPDLPIMARAHRREEYQFLLDAAATEVIQPELEASATSIRHACGHFLKLPDMQIREYLRTFRIAAEKENQAEASFDGRNSSASREL